MRVWLAAGMLALSAVSASADEWLLPTVRTYYSQDRHARFTVTPRDISSPLLYFDGKVKGKELAGQKPGSSQTFARGVLEKEDGAGHWAMVWDHRLVNDVSPVSAVVSNSARYVVTFDNWHSMGWGDDVVVIYGPNASLVRSLALKDILPADYVYALPRSVSSIWWSGEHTIAEPSDTLILKIVIPSDDDREDAKQYADLALLMPSGQVRPDAKWPQALAKAAGVAKAKRAAEKAWDLRFKSPLTAPKNSSDGDWHLYLEEAFFRLDPDWKENYPWKTVLRSPDAKDYAPSEQWVREDLDGTGGLGGPIVVASPSSPENLIRLMQATVRDLKKQTLKGVRVYICVPAAFRDRAVKALAPTGATVVYLDPAIPIPQRKERLEEYLKAHRE